MGKLTFREVSVKDDIDVVAQAFAFFTNCLTKRAGANSRLLSLAAK